MNIKLPKTVDKSTKRLGRGYGSGKGGHTVGRGQKGQKARGKIGILFEGIKVKKSLLKKLPLQRGKGKFNSREKPIIVKISLLNLLPQGVEVDLTSLVKYGIVDAEEAKTLGVKILGDGELSKKLTIAVPISHSAAKKVEKVGGKIK
jgi:large subunit ribosomal protein L15